jgi:hypothetical protein
MGSSTTSSSLLLVALLLAEKVSVLRLAAGG